MKKAVLFIGLLSLILVFSCKKQEVAQPDKVNDTLRVNSPNMSYELNENTILTLDATTPGATGYLWTPGGYTTPSINVFVEGVWTVQIEAHPSPQTCKITVYYKGTNCYIPNSFTPNGDSINDTWSPVFFNVKDQNFLLNVYDASNKKIFSSTNINAQWDGKFNGNLMPVDYYYYTVAFETNSGEKKSRNGMLQLVM